MKSHTTKVMKYIFVLVILWHIMFVGMETYSYNSAENIVIDSLRKAYTFSIKGVNQVDMGRYGIEDLDYVRDIPEYVSRLKEQNKTIGSSRLAEMLDYMNMRSTQGKLLYTPLQFGMTYIPTGRFEDEFEIALGRYIEFSFQAPNSTEILSQYTKPSAIVVDGINYNIDGPKLVGIKGNTVLQRKLFGVTDDTLIQSKDPDDDFEMYVVAYDIEVEIEWSKVTQTPLYLNLEGSRLRTYEGRDESLRGRKLVPGVPIKIHRVFTLTY